MTECKTYCEPWVVRPDPPRVVVTRAVHQAGPLCRALEGAGAKVEPLPLLEMLPGDTDAMRRAAAALQPGHWVLFTSANAVDSFLPKVPAGLRLCLRLAAVGPATARAIRGYGSEPRLEAQRSDGGGLLDALKPHLSPPAGAKSRPTVLVPQADDARPQLVEGLRCLDIDLRLVVAYRKTLPQGARRWAEDIFARGPLGWVTFTSPRIVRHFLALELDEPSAWRQRVARVKALSVGSVTSAELRRLGIEPAAQAVQPTPEAMARAWSDAWSSAE